MYAVKEDDTVVVSDMSDSNDPLYNFTPRATTHLWVRAKATSVSNPRTDGQVNQRTKFALVLAVLKPITGFLRVGYKKVRNQTNSVQRCNVLHFEQRCYWQFFC